MRTKVLIGLIAVASIGAYPLLCAESQSGDKLAMRSLEKLEVTAAKADAQKISFVVKNRSASSLKVVKDYLPWNTTCALKLLVMPLGKGMAPVEAVHPIEDPRATIQEIAGDTELRGELDVGPFFPRWNELVKQGVLLIWSLNLHDVETGRDRRFKRGRGVNEYAREDPQKFFWESPGNREIREGSVQHA